MPATMYWHPWMHWQAMNGHSATVTLAMKRISALQAKISNVITSAASGDDSDHEHEDHDDDDDDVTGNTTGDHDGTGTEIVPAVSATGSGEEDYVDEDYYTGADEEPGVLRT